MIFPANMWRTKTPTLKYSPSHSPASNHRRDQIVVNASNFDTDAHDEEHGYSYSYRGDAYSGGYGDYGEDEEEEDGVTKSEAAFLASSRRKMAAALKGYSEVNDDRDDEEDGNPYLSKYESEEEDKQSKLEEAKRNKITMKAKVVDNFKDAVSSF